MIGINLDCYRVAPLSVEEQVELMKKYGFDYTSEVTEKPDVEKKIEKVLEMGFKFAYLHGPLIDLNDMWGTGEEAEKMYENMCYGVSLCAKYNIPIFVAHLSVGRQYPPVNDEGMARYDRFLAFAKEKGIKVAFENSRCIGNLAIMLENREEVGFCWDVGHEYCYTPGMHFLPYFADKLTMIHLHDNMCVYEGDDHMIPFDGKIDMVQKAKELGEANYQAPVMLELVTAYSEEYQKMTPDEFYKRAADAAKRFEGIINENRKD
ncbi:MAG: sugar phosphate isomerase/epimerase [Clostridia bacterium]|nr:sugar phosphate isomerase/epimerase [Clostridia bacterium]